MSYEEQAHAEMWAAARSERPRLDRPTQRQIVALARLLAEKDGIAWPTSRAAASALLVRLADGEDVNAK